MNVTIEMPITSGGPSGNSGWVRTDVVFPQFTAPIEIDAYGRNKILIGVQFTLKNVNANWSVTPSSLPIPWYASGYFSHGFNPTFGGNTVFGYGSTPVWAWATAQNIQFNVSGGLMCDTYNDTHVFITPSSYITFQYWDDRPSAYYTMHTLNLSWDDVIDTFTLTWETAPAPVPGSFTQNTPQMVGINVSLSWTASQYASAYKVFRAEGTHTSTATGTWTEVVNSLTGTTYTDTTATADTTYTYYIQSSNESGTANSNFLSILTTHAPEAFLQSTPTMDGNNVSLSWAASTYATSYKIYRAEGVHTSTATGTWSEIATGVTATTYADSAIILGHTYSYYIKAVNGGGTINSDFENITTAPPSTFNQLELTYIAGTYNVKVEWEASSNADSYKVYRLDGYSNDPSSGTWVEKATTTTELTWTDTTVELGKTYSYYIKAFNDPLTTNSNPRQISVGMQQQQIL